MSTTEKVELVASVWEEHGLAPALAAVALPKSTWYYHQQYFPLGSEQKLDIDKAKTEIKKGV